MHIALIQKRERTDRGQNVWEDYAHDAEVINDFLERMEQLNVTGVFRVVTTDGTITHYKLETTEESKAWEVDLKELEDDDIESVYGA